MGESGAPPITFRNLYNSSLMRRVKTPSLFQRCRVDKFDGTGDLFERDRDAATGSKALNRCSTRFNGN